MCRMEHPCPPCETIRVVEHEFVPFWREQWGTKELEEKLTERKGMNGKESTYTK